MMLHFIWYMYTIFHFKMALETLAQGSSSEGKPINNISKPGCPTHCGNVTVPYPFGIGKNSGCSLDESFYVTCKDSELFYAYTNQEIYSISDSELRMNTGVAYSCYHKDGVVYDFYNWWSRLGTPFTFSQKNKFIVIGCDDYSLIRGTNEAEFSSRCLGQCSKALDVPDNGQCSGVGCCETSIPKGLKYFNITLSTLQNHTSVWSFNPCGYAFLGEEGAFVFQGIRDLSSDSNVWERVSSTVPVVIDWVVAPNQGCSASAVCKENSSCYDVDGGGYRCRCNTGYDGNPYLDPGCQDINECEDLRTNACYGDCINTPGGYNCTCSTGSFGDAKLVDGCKRAPDSKFSATILSIAIVFGLLALLAGGGGFFFGVRRRKLIRLREKFFEQNGGVLLKQKMNSQGSHEAMTLFSSDQLCKATNNYSQEKIIGRGAYGVVYKGVLTDKRVVAIKKSKVVDENQAEQFVNEVLILSQVIHRNVVKLLGCCLEEEVPILVYEFISNNTLFHHIHYREGGMSWLSWENRLRVAVEAAGALAYLHSETIMPIIHRDVKSTNILLDDNYTAKISDFGASRLVPLDHKEVTTLIQGTLGYLDPEYFHTSQLTDKSDVYSFGVVLAELITGKKPIGIDRINEEKNLATYFVNSVQESRLFEIVEPRLLREGSVEQLKAVGDIIKRCLNSHGCDRPTMKDVVVELDGIRKFTTHPHIKKQTNQKTGSFVREVEQLDLYDVQIVSIGTSESDLYSGR